MRLVAPCLLFVAACSSSSPSDEGLFPPFTACASELYYEGGSEPANHVVYLYDQEGWSRIDRSDADGDGVIDFEARGRYHGDRWDEYQEWTRPDGGPLALSYAQQWYWDGDQLSYYVVDEDGVGGVDYAWTYVYTDGRLSDAQYDQGADGERDSVWHLRYDDEGHHIATDVWWGGSKYEDVQTFAYDAQDRLIAQEDDTDLDGEMDQHFDFDFDAYGWRSLSRKTYLDGSGTVFELAWEHTAERTLRRHIRDLENDELLSHRWVEYRYDCE